MQALQGTPVTALRDLNFPYPDDLTDAFTLKTDSGQGFVDQGTGKLVAWSNLSAWNRMTETIYMLHTGRGAAVLGLVLGLMALDAPVMAGTGTLMWVASRRSRPRLRDNASAAQADTILLVGSEGGGSWGFAALLHAALTAAGGRVHTAPMSAFAPGRYHRAARIVVLATTYGNGTAPASAKGFLDRLATLPAVPIPLTVLGFGDRSFPIYCGFAQDVAVAAKARGWVVAIERPDHGARAPLAIMALHDAAIATSGDYRHGVAVGDRRLAHTMDPARGGPLAVSPASVTVVAATCMMADAWATALMVSGSVEGADLARKHDLNALFIDRDGNELRETRVGRLFEPRTIPSNFASPESCVR